LTIKFTLDTECLGAFTTALLRRWQLVVARQYSIVKDLDSSQLSTFSPRLRGPMVDG